MAEQDKMKIVYTEKAPKPVGPYSQAIQSVDYLFCSGQIALNPETGDLMGKTAAEQAEFLLQNLNAVLKAAGLNAKHVVKTTIFLLRMSDFQAVNQVYEKFFENHKPARSTVAVSELPKGAQVEIECIASLY